MRGLTNTTGLLKSKLERIRRFFAYQEIDYKSFALAIVLSVFKKIPMLYVHMAVLLNEIFFPKTDLHTASLIAAFFYSTYVLRPFGAILFGYRWWYYWT
jgi:hypothetical protein